VGPLPTFKPQESFEDPLDHPDYELFSGFVSKNLIVVDPKDEILYKEYISAV
jgi:hypothetical protein